MKRCKKLLCLVLALVMALSLCTVAMAAEGAVTNVYFSMSEEEYGYGIAINADTKKHFTYDGYEHETTTPGGDFGTASVVILSEDCDILEDGATEGSFVSTSDKYFKANKQYYLKIVYSFQNYAVAGDFAAIENTWLKCLGDDYDIETVEVGTESSDSYTAVFKLPMLEENNYTAEIPFTKVVELGGNTEPAAKRFELEWVETTIGATIIGGETAVNPNPNQQEDPADYVDVTGYVDTNGAGNYDGMIYVTGPKYYVDLFLMQNGFFVREKNDNAAGWTYDDQMWYVVYENWYGNDSATEYAFIKVDDTAYRCNHNESGTSNHETAMTFTNTYTENTTHEHTRRQPSTPTTPEAPVASPKTGDMGVALYAAMAVLSMSGSAVILGKKRSK